MKNRPTRIKSLRELAIASGEKWSVIVPKSTGFSKPKPAAFVFELHGTVIFRLMKLGMFIYEKGRKNYV